MFFTGEGDFFFSPGLSSAVTPLQAQAPQMPEALRMGRDARKGLARAGS